MTLRFFRPLSSLSTPFRFSLSGAPAFPHLGGEVGGDVALSSAGEERPRSRKKDAMGADKVESCPMCQTEVGLTCETEREGRTCAEKNSAPPCSFQEDRLNTMLLASVSVTGDVCSSDTSRGTREEEKESDHCEYSQSRAAEIPGIVKGRT